MLAAWSFWRIIGSYTGIRSIQIWKRGCACSSKKLR